MGQGRRRFTVLAVAVAAVACWCGLAVPPAPAQAPLPISVLNDGDWIGSLGASGPLDIEEFHGEVIYEGTFEFSVWQGEITEGTWQIGGSGTASHPRVTGTVSYLANGVMTGRADGPEMIPSGLTAAYDLVVNGTPLSGTMEFTADEVLSFSIPLVSTTCDLAVGNWDLPANMVYQRAGGSSSIVGWWFASRVGGSELGGVDQASLDQAFRGLLRRIDTLADNAYQTGRIDFVALHALVSEGEWFNQRLVLGTRCAGRPLLGWINPIGQAILGLLGWALDNSELLTDTDLFQLISAAVRTNVLGSRAPDNELTRELRPRLAMELLRRAEAAADCGAAHVVSVAASALVDSGAIAAVEAAVAEVCP